MRDDVASVLQNAANYEDPWRALYIAAFEEVIELRLKVLALGETLPPKTSSVDGKTRPQQTCLVKRIETVYEQRTT